MAHGARPRSLWNGRLHRHDGLRELASFIDEAAQSYAAELDEARITRKGALLLSNTTHARSSSTTHIELFANRFANPSWPLRAA